MIDLSSIPPEHRHQAIISMIKAERILSEQRRSVPAAIKRMSRYDLERFAMTLIYDTTKTDAEGKST